MSNKSKNTEPLLQSTEKFVRDAAIFSTFSSPILFVAVASFIFTILVEIISFTEAINYVLGTFFLSVIFTPTRLIVPIVYMVVSWFFARFIASKFASKVDQGNYRIYILGVTLTTHSLAIIAIIVYISSIYARN